MINFVDMNVKIEESWRIRLQEEFDKPYFIELTQWVRHQYRTEQIFPPGKEIFAAFDASPYDKTKVVIIGQDPYHGEGQANGLCFSVKPDIQMPPSLINIFKEVRDDIGTPIPENGDLTRWAKQGVLLLNATLTVKAHSPKSHSNRGWERFTDFVVHDLAENKNNLVFILWGSDAKRKCDFIDRSRHLVLSSAHPSPLSAYRGFFGNHHFSLANNYLIKHGQQPIIW